MECFSFVYSLVLWSWWDSRTCFKWSNPYLILKPSYGFQYVTYLCETLERLSLSGNVASPWKWEASWLFYGHLNKLHAPQWLVWRKNSTVPAFPTLISLILPVTSLCLQPQLNFLSSGVNTAQMCQDLLANKVQNVSSDHFAWHNSGAPVLQCFTLRKLLTVSSKWPSMMFFCFCLLSWQPWCSRKTHGARIGCSGTCSLNTTCMNSYDLETSAWPKHERLEVRAHTSSLKNAISVCVLTRVLDHHSASTAWPS